jgi:hypothetical protein
MGETTRSGRWSIRGTETNVSNPGERERATPRRAGPRAPAALSRTVHSALSDLLTEMNSRPRNTPVTCGTFSSRRTSFDPLASSMREKCCGDGVG